MAQSAQNTPTPATRFSAAPSANGRKPAAPDGALGAAFARALDALKPEGRMAVAVSGGSDSLALLHLTIDWTRARELPPPVALTVDHGLRAGSAAEAASVAARAGALGVEHVTLTWDGAKPATRLQERARAARYALLGEWCRANNIANLLLGHTLDDQLETVAMRRAHRSGEMGLAGMPSRYRLPHLPEPSVVALRPLVWRRRSDLRVFLTARGEDWLDDPSNDDPRFERVRVRTTQASAREDARVLIGAQRGRIARERETLALLAACARVTEGGFVLVDRERFSQAEADTRQDALAQMVLAIGGQDYAPDATALSDLDVAIWDGELGQGRTLGHCKIASATRALGGAEAFMIVGREPASCRASLTLLPCAVAVWDGRFDLANESERAWTVAPLAADAARLRRSGRVPDWPSWLLQTLPNVAAADGSIAVSARTSWRLPWASEPQFVAEIAEL